MIWRSLVAALLLACACDVRAQCTTTLNVGANVATAVSSAAAGATICLNSGSWGTINLFNITKSNYVTVKSTTGLGASAYFSIGNSQFIRVDSVTLTGALLNSCSRNIIISNSSTVPNSGSGIYIDGTGCPTTAQNITIDGVIFDRVGPALYEGRLSVRDGNTITVKNSQFLGVWATNGGPSDGFQGVGAMRNITIGPGNLFQGIDQGICNANGGAHCDNIQLYGGPCDNISIDNNLFRDTSSLILTESACTGTTRNNVFDNVVTVQFHQWHPVIFEHNTLYNSNVSMNGSPGAPMSATIRSNIVHSSDISTGGITPCAACTFDYNLYSSGCNGTNCITGTPTYVGGAPASIAAWSGWQLSPASLGRSNGHDGLDRGTLFYGSADTEAPTTPTNLIGTTISATQIDLSWTASTDNTGVAGYEILRCSGAACTPASVVQSTVGAGTTWSNTGLTGSTLYRYTVQARDAVPNYSAQSAVAQATTSPALLPGPSSLWWWLR